MAAGLARSCTSTGATSFRAGHAHAGVSLILSLAYYSYLGLTSLALNTQYLACTLLLGGIILQSGGFFWHAFLDGVGPEEPELA